MRIPCTVEVVRLIAVYVMGLILITYYVNNDAFAAAHAECAVCHKYGEPKTNNADLVQELPDLCIECHSGRVAKNEHIINVPPPASMESKWLRLPLIDGLISCTTCHDSHATSPALLQLPSNELCAACHDV